MTNKTKNVGRLNDFEELIGCVVGKTTDSSGCVVETDSELTAMGNDFIEFELLVFDIDEIVLVIVEDQPLDSPMVVDEIRIKKINTPTLALRRETTEKKHTGVGEDEGLEGMILDIASRFLDVIDIEERHYKIKDAF